MIKEATNDVLSAKTHGSLNHLDKKLNYTIVYIIENLYRMHEENGVNELTPKWNDALRESMKVLNSTKERTQTISDYIQYGEYLLDDMQLLKLHVLNI